MVISKEKQPEDVKSQPAQKQPAFRLTDLPLKVLLEAERELVSEGSSGVGRSVASCEPLGWCVVAPKKKVSPKMLVGLVLVAEPLVTLAVWLFAEDACAAAATLGTSSPWASKYSVTSSVAGMLLGS